MLAKSKLISTETLVCQALINIEISHEKFVIILKGKDKYEKMNIYIYIYIYIYSSEKEKNSVNTKNVTTL